jgi:RNA polymerase sigma factor (sigma-70 family)
MDELTDAEALRASRSDPHAFVAVFERHFDAVHRYLRRRVPADLADDLVAETFLRAFQHRGRYRAQRPDARPWLYGIATNLVRRHYRSEERELRALARSAVTQAPEEPAEDETRLGEALAALPRRERDVLLLYAWTELSYEEIAVALGVRIGTVRSRLHRARARLRELLPPERRYPSAMTGLETEVGDG